MRLVWPDSILGQSSVLSHCLSYTTVNQSGYEPLNLEKGSSVNSGNSHGTELSFLSIGRISFISRARGIVKK